MASIIQSVIGIVTGVIGLVIVDNVVKVQSWNSSLSTTISGYLVPVGMLGLFGAAAFMYYR